MIKYFSNEDIKNIVDNTVIVVDTREKANSHIIECLEENKVKYIVKKVPYGDYSCMLPAGTIGNDDIYFFDEIVIERKASIDEIAINLKDDKRIKTEFAHIQAKGIKCLLFIEDNNYFVNLRSGNYRSQYEPATLLARIKKGLELKYNIPIIPVEKSVIGSEIVETMKAFIYNKFKY